MAPPKRAETAQEAVPDLHWFLDEGRPFGERDEPEATRNLADRLFEHLGQSLGFSGDRDAPQRARELASRVVTDGLLRGECDRDQNVYMGRIFTRHMTRAVPDLLFLPASAREVAAALAFGREHDVPITLRGAASTAMGGAIPADAGIALDFARLDSIEVAGETDGKAGVVRFGAGTRMRPLHAEVRKHGFALPVYPSNLGGTYVGWLVTGGIGMNAFGGGRALDPVRGATLALPGGELVRLAADGTSEVWGDGEWQSAGEDWFRARGYEALSLADLAGSEGQFGAVLELEVELEPLRDLGAFLLSFEKREDALAAVDWVARRVREGQPAPADVKLLSGSHLHHVREVWSEEDGKRWREQPGKLATDALLPWAEVLGPRAFGVTCSKPPAGERTYLFVDFLGREHAAVFAKDLGACPGSPAVLDEESIRFARDRFRPQQVKRLGPGFLAAEIQMPSDRIGAFLPAAERLARSSGFELDAEVYYLADDTALAIAGYLSDHRKGSFPVDLLLAPALMDLAIARFAGKPYVLGRWQANLLSRKFGGEATRALRARKASLDPDHVVNRGSFFDMGLRGILGAGLRGTMGPSVRLVRLMVTLGSGVAGIVRSIMARFPGPAAGRGYTTHERPLEAGVTPAGEHATGRALHCVNCGECNSVCPIFQESKVRLPQMLTHLGESVHAGESVGESGSALLDLCMRCGNCEEVCQAGIPHLPLYGEMQTVSDDERPRDRDRHVLLLERLRASEDYTRRFLDARPGGYVVRAPASLPGSARYLLLREEGDAGPAATCIHCAACVDVCPTGANEEYQGDDPRWITTDQAKCIGCGTCVEVCPANLANGGQTLRVMEAPLPTWFEAAREFAAREDS